jgi:hypothetical protein
MSFSRAAALGLALLAPTGGASAATLFGPTPYTSVADVPVGFYASGAPDVLENFDEFVRQPDGSYLIDFPAGVTFGGIGNTGLRLALPFGEGVPQVFDPTVDSVGTGGQFGGASLSVQPEPNRIVTRIGFGFFAATRADLPTAAGIVWTDGPRGLYTFEFLGRNEFFNTITLAEVTLTLGDDTFLGTNPDGTRNTAEDRFVGLTHAGGITGFSVTSASAGIFELDDLQWGRMAEPPAVVPLPAGLPLLAGALGLMAALRRAARRAGPPRQ